ncbi:Uncharacterised protein [uncultured archaeon]|nr:Uncharacterised protein [uncultured archaeon]
MAIEIALEKFRGEPASIAHTSGDSRRMDSNPEWRRVKGRVFNALSGLGVEDIRIVVRGKRAGEVAGRVKAVIERLERPKPGTARTC